MTVQSEGEIIQRRNSRIDVSGGTISYLPGYVNTTKLIANRAFYDLDTASPDMRYSGIANLPNFFRNYEPGYTVGKDAGWSPPSAPAIVMQGELQGSTTIGKYQREVGSTARPLGGKLVIGSDNVAGLSAANSHEAGYHGKLVFVGSFTQHADAPGLNESFDEQNPDHALLADRLDIDTAALSKAGFSRLIATTAGDIDIAAPLSLAAGGEVGLVGRPDRFPGRSQHARRQPHRQGAGRLDRGRRPQLRPGGNLDQRRFCLPAQPGIARATRPATSSSRAASLTCPADRWKSAITFRWTYPAAPGRIASRS